MRYLIMILTVICAIFYGDVAHANQNADSQLINLVTLDLPGRTLPPDYFGMNVFNQCDDPNASWTSSTTATVLASFSPSTIRFPGGLVGNYWDWKTGHIEAGFDSYIPFTSVYDDTLPNFKTLLSRANNPVPLFDLNVMAYQCPNCAKGVVIPANVPVVSKAETAALVNDQIAMLQAASAEGLPVKYIELGNEMYLGGSSDSITANYYTAFPTGAYYGEVMRDYWIPPLHRAFPAAQISVVGAPGAYEAWNQGTINAQTGANAMTLHPYISVPQADLGTSNQAVLAAAFERWQAFAPVISGFGKAGLPTWITEFDMIDDTINPKTNPNGTYAPLWLHGLFVAHMMMDFMVDPDVTMVDFFNMIKSQGDTAILFKSDGTPYYSSAGEALAILGNALKGATQVVPLELGTNTPFVQIDLPHGGTPYYYPGAEGVWVEQGGATQHLIMVNYSVNPVYFDFSKYPNVQKDMKFMQTISTDISTNIQLNPVAPTCFNGGVMSQNIVTLPPYSINDLSNAMPEGCNKKL